MCTNLNVIINDSNQVLLRVAGCSSLGQTFTPTCVFGILSSLFRELVPFLGRGEDLRPGTPPRCLFPFRTPWQASSNGHTTHQTTRTSTT